MRHGIHFLVQMLIPGCTLDVLMDDCWQAASRDPKTNAPRADPEKFPNGIKALSDEIHSLGLKVSPLYHFENS